MPWVFSYGSLQQSAVQLATFGRLLQGSPDVLVGFERSLVTHGSRQHANVSRCADPSSQVRGMAFEITETELETADAYERADDYTRIPVVLASGLDAWVYVDGHHR